METPLLWQHASPAAQAPAIPRPVYQCVPPAPWVRSRTSAAAARALAAVRAHTTPKTGHPLRQLASSVPLAAFVPQVPATPPPALPARTIPTPAQVLHLNAACAAQGHTTPAASQLPTARCVLQAPSTPTPAPFLHHLAWCVAWGRTAALLAPTRRPLACHVQQVRITPNMGHHLLQLACPAPPGKLTPTSAPRRAPPAPPLPSPQTLVLPCAAPALQALIVRSSLLLALHARPAAVALLAVAPRAHAKCSSTSP